ncbi:MAG: hypothetical protein WC145_03045 [Aliarcobacter sp.]|jgi:hypothetical protein
MENRTDFFEKNLQKIVKKELKLEEHDIEINVKETGIESIPVLIDTYYQIIVTDGYFQTLNTFWDTTNIEILGQKIKNQLKILDMDEYRFYIFEKDKNDIKIRCTNFKNTKNSNYLIVE